MSKFVINLNVEIDTDHLIANLKTHNIVKADGSVNGVNAHEYLKGYINGAVAAKIDTTDVLKEVIADLDKKLNTKDLF